MFGGKVENLLQDLKVVRPTVIYAVPRVWSWIRDDFNNDVTIAYPKQYLSQTTLI